MSWSVGERLLTYAQVGKTYYELLVSPDGETKLGVHSEHPFPGTKYIDVSIKSSTTYAADSVEETGEV